MRVGAKGEGYLGVAKDLHGYPGGYPLLQEHCCRGVPCVVEACLAYASVFEEVSPGSVVGAGVERLAVGLGEDEVVVLPEWAGGESFAVLLDPVGFERVDERDGEGDGSPSGAGLRWDADEAAT